MNTERLLLLANHLDTISEQSWNFGVICRGEVLSCDTVGCALGHCPEVWPDVFKLVVHPKYGWISIECNCDRDWREIAKFFDILYSTTEMVFNNDDLEEVYGCVSSSEVTAKMVANKIRQLVETGSIKHVEAVC